MNNKSIIYFSAIVFGIAFSWFFTWPKLMNIESLDKQIEDAAHEGAVLEATIDSIGSQASFYRSLPEEDIEKIDLAITPYPDEINLVNLIYDIIADSGMLANDVSADVKKQAVSSGKTSVADPEKPLLVSVSISVNGPYDLFKELLKELERNLRIFNIQDLDVESSVGEISQTFIIRGESYYMPSTSSN